jgi:hypothetical protein
VSRFLKCAISCAVLASSALVAGFDAPVRALSFAGQTNFPVCVAATDEFCIEKFEFTPTGGTVRTVTPSTEPFGVVAPDGTGLPDVNVTASFFANYTGPTGTADETGFLPALALNFFDRGSSPVGSASTAVGLRDGSYRVVLRTGDYDPSLLTLTGQYVSYSVTKGSDNYFTVDLTAKPKPLARVVVLSGDNSAITNCESSNWVGTCASNQASKSYLNASFSMLSMAQYRDAMRGAWISTNASTTQISIADLLKGQVNVVAKGPHTLPADFGDAGVGIENGKYLNPAFFEEYIPFALISMMMSLVSSSTITTDMVKNYLSGPSANPTAVLTGSISVSNSGAAPVSTPQTLGITTDANGVRVDFKLTHFSAPNPSLKVSVPAATPTTTVASAGPTTTTVAPVVTTTTTTVAPVVTTTTTVAPVVTTTTTAPKAISPTVKLSRSASAKSIAAFAKLKVLSTSKVKLKVVASSAKFCRVSGTSLRGLKAGSCKVTVTVTPKKGRATSKTITLKIAK